MAPDVEAGTRQSKRKLGHDPAARPARRRARPGGGGAGPAADPLRVVGFYAHAGLFAEFEEPFWAREVPRITDGRLLPSIAPLETTGIRDRSCSPSSASACCRWRPCPWRSPPATTRSSASSTCPG
ncbi:hypothetical protein ACFQY5_26240 [Paeniroseomonas aquatica]|uniref:hypothetical protein n=1 Tax=Paeniroseomonas aquatica TaxID=373043 RepID=UPI0036134E47